MLSSLSFIDQGSLGGHEQYTQNLTDSRQPARVNLNDVDRFRLQELFEYHAVMSMFPGSYSDSMWFERIADGCVAQDVVRSSGFFDKPDKNRATFQ
jgi:hypothetical protein